MLEILQEILAILHDLNEMMDASHRFENHGGVNISLRIRDVRKKVQNLQASETQDA